MNHPLRHVLLLAAVLLAGPGAASPARQALPTPQAIAAEPASGLARPALWRVSDADTTIYLFGTIHALPPGVEWFDGDLAQAFDASSELVTEITETDPTEMQSLVMAKAMLPPGQSLRGLLPPSDRSGFETALAAYGLPVGAFDRFEPWYAAIGLSTLPLMQQGYNTANGVEGALDARAKALGHPHSALETAEFQLGLFDALPMDVQKKYLHDVIDGLPKLKDELDQIVRVWSTGDAEKLAALMNEDDGDDPVMLEKLLTGRNRTWAGWIKARMARPGSLFIAVGAGHLAGQGSVQQQLAALGIIAVRVQ